MTRKDFLLWPDHFDELGAVCGERAVPAYSANIVQPWHQHDANGKHLAEQERVREPIPDALMREVQDLIENAHEPVDRERTKLRLRLALGEENLSLRLDDIIMAAKRRSVPMEIVLGKRASIEIEGNEIRVCDVEIPADGWSRFENRVWQKKRRGIVAASPIPKIVSL